MDDLTTVHQVVGTRLILSFIGQTQLISCRKLKKSRSGYEIIDRSWKQRWVGDDRCGR